jgi:hypothetical protein
MNTTIIYDILLFMFSLNEGRKINGDIVLPRGPFSKLLIIFSQSLLLCFYIKLCENVNLGS